MMRIRGHWARHSGYRGSAAENRGGAKRPRAGVVASCSLELSGPWGAPEPRRRRVVLSSAEAHRVGGTAVFAGNARSSRHRQAPVRARRRRTKLAVAIGVVVVVVMVARAFAVYGQWRRADPPAASLTRGPLPTSPASYIGIYRRGVPLSYDAVTKFTAATGVTPEVVTYYSGVLEPFQGGFAASVAKHGAGPLVQINPP